MNRSLHWKCVPFCLLLLILPTIGCGKGLPPTADATRAREGLVVALDTWQKGEKLDDLQRRSPPIYFKDLSLMKGSKLMKYEVAPELSPKGQSLLCSVTLYLQDEDGKERERKSVYCIDTHPAIVILPDSN